MNQKEVSIKEMHRCTLTVLKKIIEICDENSILYFLAYGSLLGAVRHKGFIPWDDDCDVLMLRPDYDRFVRFCDKHRKELLPFRLMNRFNTPNYPFGISRFCDTRFKMVRDKAESAGMGLFVDIYPYDGMGNGKFLEHLHIGYFRTYYTRMTNYANLNSFVSSRNKIFNLLRRLLYAIAKKNGSDYYLNKLEKLANRYPYISSKYVGAIIWGTGDYHFEKTLFEESTLLEFEGVKVNAPRRYHELLTICYGNYMRLPPESERQQSHGYKLYRVDNISTFSED